MNRPVPQPVMELRRPLVDPLAKYLQLRAAADQLRSTPDPAVTARLMVETTSWFARHRFRDPDGAAIDDDAAREAVVDILVHELMPLPAPSTDRSAT